MFDAVVEGDSSENVSTESGSMSQAEGDVCDIELLLWEAGFGASNVGAQPHVNERHIAKELLAAHTVHSQRYLPVGNVQPFDIEEE